jgi:hypothetical protein
LLSIASKLSIENSGQSESKEEKSSNNSNSSKNITITINPKIKSIQDIDIGDINQNIEEIKDKDLIDLKKKVKSPLYTPYIYTITNTNNIYTDYINPSIKVVLNSRANIISLYNKNLFNTLKSINKEVK